MPRPKNTFAEGRKRLLEFIKQNQAVTASDKRLSEELGISTRSIQRYLASFAAEGVVTVERKRYKPNRCNWCNFRTVYVENSNNEG